MVQDVPSSATAVNCCTRCGARVVPHENFCQQCGARTRSRIEDTTIGACTKCGTHWRSAWLFCRNCGLDRDNALGFGSQALPLEVVPTVTSMEAVRVPKVVEVPPGDVRRTCPRCAVEITGDTQFCEICGQGLGAASPEARSVPDIPQANARQSSDTLHVVDAETYVPTLEMAIPLGESPPLAPQDEVTKIEDENVAEVPANPIQSEPQTTRTTDFNPSRDTAKQDPNVRMTVEQRTISTGRMEEEAANDKGRLYVVPDLSSSTSFKKPHVTPPPPPPPRKPAVSVTNDLDSNPFLSADEELALEIEENFNNSRSLDYLEEQMAARHPEAVPSRSRFQRASAYFDSGGKRRRSVSKLELTAFILALAVLGVLLTVITWQANRKRETPSQPETLRTTPTANVTPAVFGSSTTPASPSAPQDMVYVPASTFSVGRNDGDEYDRPAKTVSVPAFFIDRNEVTNEEYQKFVDATHHSAPSHWQNGKFPSGQARLPVVNVSWNDAVDYARWAKKRLPSEAEWELAARGTDGRIYPWGSQWNSANANTKDGGRGAVSEVGSYPQGASPYGALDMAGNVWEWTSSDLLSYQDRHPLLPGKVIRGGAFDVASNVATSTYRGVVRRDKGYEKTGFRCVRSIR